VLFFASTFYSVVLTDSDGCRFIVSFSAISICVRTNTALSIPQNTKAASNKAALSIALLYTGLIVVLQHFNHACARKFKGDTP
jgi:hypothetical protein